MIKYLPHTLLCYDDDDGLSVDLVPLNETLPMTTVDPQASRDADDHHLVCSVQWWCMYNVGDTCMYVYTYDI